MAPQITAALLGLTTTSLTKARTKSLVSVSTYDQQSEAAIFVGNRIGQRRSDF